MAKVSGQDCRLWKLSASLLLLMFRLQRLFGSLGLIGLKYDLTDPALQQLAAIVRGADTSRLELTPQSAGLYALSLGLSKTFFDDHEMLRHGMVMYDALYAWVPPLPG